jgi:hypothetical protein
MSEGHEPWSRYQNDLWHWFKHAQPFILGGMRRPAEMTGIKTEQEYVSLASAICRAAANGVPGTEVRLRTKVYSDRLVQQYIVWCESSSQPRSLFIVVNDCGSHGELVTMFPPEEGRAYFEREQAELIH